MISEAINGINRKCNEQLDKNLKKILDRYNLTLKDIKNNKEYEFKEEIAEEPYKISITYIFIKNDEELAKFKVNIITDVKNYNVTTQITDVYFMK